jgi:hypothetical protein
MLEQVLLLVFVSQQVVVIVQLLMIAEWFLCRHYLWLLLLTDWHCQRLLLPQSQLLVTLLLEEPQMDCSRRIRNHLSLVWVLLLPLVQQRISSLVEFHLPLL